MNSTGIPAFPSSHTYDSGMSLRDWFAGQVIPVIAASRPLLNVATMDEIESMGRCAYQIADAMIAARGETK